MGNLSEELLNQSYTPLKVIPIVDKQPIGISQGNIWFDVGKHSLHVVKSDGTIVELTGNNIQLNRSTINPEFYATTRYTNLGQRCLLGLDNICLNLYSGYKINKYVDFNYQTQNFVYMNTSTQLNIYNINTTNQQQFNAPSGKTMKSIHCSLKTSYCYILYTDGTIGYFDLNNLSTTGVLSLPNNDTAIQCTDTLNYLYILGSSGTLYAISAGSTSIQSTGHVNVRFISDNYNAYNLIFVDTQINVLDSSDFGIRKSFSLNLNPYSFLYDDLTQNLYCCIDRIENYAISATSYTHCSDVNLQSLSNEYIQLTKNQYSLNYQGKLYQVLNYSKFVEIQTPNPIYQLCGYDDGVCLVDNNGYVHYFLQSTNAIFKQNMINIKSSQAFQNIINDRYGSSILAPQGSVSYGSVTPDSDYQYASSVTITLNLQNVNINNPFTFIQFVLDNKNITESMGNAYNSVAFTRNGFRIPFIMNQNSDGTYTVTLIVPTQSLQSPFVVVMNYGPLNPYPMNYTLQPRTTIAYSILTQGNVNLNPTQIPVFIDKTKYSKYQLKVLTMPIYNYRITYLFNNQYPNCEYTRFVGGVLLDSTLPCATFHSDVLFLISEVVIENMPGSGVQITSTLVRNDTECRECVFIPESELVDNGGYYNLGSIIMSGGTSAGYVVVSRIV